MYINLYIYIHIHVYIYICIYIYTKLIRGPVDRLYIHILPSQVISDLECEYLAYWSGGH